MFQENVLSFRSLPTQERRRYWTDCCCTLLTATFAIVMFILSFALYEEENFFQVNFPVDDMGKTCGYDRQQAPLIYFSNPKDITSGKYCLKRCPGHNEPLQCAQEMHSACVALGGSTYSTEQVINRLGAFCMPTDHSLADEIWSNPQLGVKSSILNSLDIILLSLLLAFCVGVIFLILMNCCPKILIYSVFLLGFLTLLISGICVLAKPVQMFDPNGWNIFLGIVMILVSLICLAWAFIYRRELQLAGIFLEHANRALKDTPLLYAYIPLFLVATFGLIVLCIWQYVAFGATKEAKLEQGDLFRTSDHNMVLTILNVIEFLWGLQFLRDAFNYVVSGNSVEWYFRDENNQYGSHCCHPFSRMVKKNWGSVAGGSFLNAFFTLPDVFFDCFQCDPRGVCGKCTNCYDAYCCCDYIFQLVRTDVYAYINLSGVPYCDAARQCQSLCRYNQYFRSSQSCLRLYRIMAHISLVCLVSMIAYFMLEVRVSYTNAYVIAIIVIATYCILTYFIDMHGHAAEGLMVCYLVEDNCEKGEQMEVCPDGLLRDIERYKLAE